MEQEHKMQHLRKEVQPFAKSEIKLSIRQLINTVLPLIGIWTLGYLFASVSPWIAVASAILASGFVIRTFIIFHDCTHGSFFTNRKLNDYFGLLTGILTSFPYEKWKNEHLIHHATSSNLDKRGIGDIEMLTIDEYYEKSRLQRIFYRLYRNPIVMFGLGPLYLVLGQNRFNRKKAKAKERINLYINNAIFFGLCAVLVLLFGWQTFLLVHGITLFIAGALGIWLFYIQHTYEDSYFENDAEWSYVKAAVEGSSYYKLPLILQWITGNIGYHHVHHLSPRIPNYKLQDAHETVKPLQEATTITLKTSLQTLRYKLYDQANMRFVTFAQAKTMMRK